jgi:X8 domain
VTSTTTLHIATQLPPTPNGHLCTCMMQNAECVQKENATVDKSPPNKPNFLISGLELADSALYERVCGSDTTDARCVGSTTDTSVGRYGAFSVCNKDQRISWVLNRHYLSQKRDQSACTLLGGTIQTPKKQQSKQCQYLLRQAGPNGTGEVVQTPDEDSLSDQSGQNGLSAAAKGGIGAAVAIFVLLSIVAFILRQRWRRKNQTQPEQFQKAELPDSAVPRVKKDDVFQSGGTPILESSPVLIEASNGDIMELPTIHNEPVELEATESRSPGTA